MLEQIHIALVRRELHTITHQSELRRRGGLVGIGRDQLRGRGADVWIRQRWRGGSFNASGLGAFSRGRGLQPAGRSAWCFGWFIAGCEVPHVACNAIHHRAICAWRRTPESIVCGPERFDDAWHVRARSDLGHQLLELALGSIARSR